MQRERVAEDIHVFTSDRYVQVTAGAIITEEGAIVIDTLVFPDETLQMKRYIETRLGAKVRYVINTHFHADHTTGTCFFEDAQVIGHVRCRELLDQRGRESLEHTKTSADELRTVKLTLPNIVFDEGVFTLHIGGKTLQLWHTPGHSLDSIVCLVKEDRVLFAADTVMPIPYFVDGSYEALLTSLRGLQGRNLENVVQGHGEVILRGEIEERLQGDIDYLVKVQQAVDKALVSANPEKALQAIDIERCGKSRILLNGTAPQLHRQNVLALASQRREVIQL